MEIKQVSSPTSPLKASRPLTAQPLTEKTASPSTEKTASRAFGTGQLNFNSALTPETMSELDKLASMELAPGIDREELIKTVIQNIQAPESITQGDRQTCAAATVQTVLAKQDPAEYVRLVAGLASPEGKVSLQDGSVLARDTVNLDNSRSIVDNLMQPALMQRATGNGYDAAKDTRRDGKGQGLYAAEQAKLTEAVLGKKTVAVKGNDVEVMQALEAALKGGNAVSATLLVKDPATGAVKGHAVAIEKIEKGLVTFIDPKKGKRVLPVDRFQAQLESVNLPKENLTRSLKSRVMGENEGILAAGFFKKLFKGIGNLFKSITSTLIKDIIKNFSKMFKPLFDMAKTVMDTLKDVGKLIEKVAPLLKTALPAILMVIPGGQPFALALSAYQAIESGVNIVKAVKNGDWKGALTGAASLLGAVAGGVGGAGAKLFGEGALKVAAVAQKGADILNKATAVVDAIETKNPSALLGAISNTGIKMGEGFTNFANKALEVYDKANDYATKAKAAYDAARGGDILDSIAAVGDLAADVTGDKELTKISNTAKKVQGISNAVKKGDVTGALNSAKDLGVKVPSQVAQTAAYAQNAKNVMEAFERGDLNELVSMAKESGVKLDPEAEEALRQLQNL